MKVGLLTAGDFPYGGASENFTRLLAKGLSNEKVNIDIIRFWGDRYNNENDTQIKCSNFLFKRPAESKFLKIIEHLFQLLYTPFFVISRKLFHKDEVLILYGIERCHFALPIMIMCKILGISCVRIIAEIYPDSLLNVHFWKKPMTLSYKWQLKVFDRFMDGILVLSHFLKKECLQNKVKKERIILIPHFIDLNLPRSEEASKTRYRVGFCGLLSVDNGVLDIINAFNTETLKDNKDIELVVMGRILDDTVDEIERLKNDNIRFTGFLTKSEVEHELSCCDLLVNPRRSGLLADSGFPTKLGEYFATRNPVISTSVGDLTDYFEHENQLLFAKPNEPQSLAQQILIAYTNPKGMIEMGERGFVWAQENLDYHTNGKLLYGFLNSLDR